MQAEREGKTSAGFPMPSFDEAEKFDQKRLDELLNDPEVKEVHVFKATPTNLKFAAYRKAYPNATRKQIRAHMKKERSSDHQEYLKRRKAKETQ